VRSISEQLGSPQKPVEFDDRGVVRLLDWTPFLSSRPRGVARLNRAEHEGRTALRIAVGPGGGVGAWRTRVLLKPGEYRFEGNAQTHGVGHTGGVSLRVRGTRDPSVRTSDDAWSAASCTFVVAQPLAEVELICELQAGGGEAWFDQESLRLVRK
jgi:hypothetical protein